MGKIVGKSKRNQAHGRIFNSKFISWTKTYRTTIIKEFSGAVEQATSTGIKFNAKIIIDNWELIFSPAREAGQLPVIKHAVYLP